MITKEENSFAACQSFINESSEIAAHLFTKINNVDKGMFNEYKTLKYLSRIYPEIEFDLLVLKRFVHTYPIYKKCFSK